jgi:bacteriorhodopsin
MSLDLHAGFLVFALLLLALAAIPLARLRRGPSIVYALAALIATAAAVSAFLAVAGGTPLRAQLPLGLPST